MKTKLKKIRSFNNWIVLIALSIAITSCSKDDGPNNQAPDQTTLSVPSDKATDVSISNLELQWAAVTDPNNDPVSYQVYLDTVNPPMSLVTGNLNGTSFTLLEDLHYGTTYYWSVTAKDDSEAESISKVAMFTTEQKPIDQKLLGKWMVESTISAGKHVPAGECFGNSYMTFNDDGELRFVTYYGDPCSKTADESYNYELTSAGNLILSLPTGSSEATIIEIITLTDTHLSLMLSEELQYNLIKQ